MSFGFTWRAQSTIYRDSVDLLAIREIGNELEVVKPIEFTVERIPRHSAIGEPSLELPHDSANSLMQALWDAGVRPNNGEGSGAEVSALKKHIAFAERVTVALLPEKKQKETS